MNANKLGDLQINGIGSSNGGTFHKVQLNGKGTVNGDAECTIFECNGAGVINGNMKAEQATVSGSAKINGQLTAAEINVNGSASIQENVQMEKMTVSGKASVGGNLKGEEITVNGKVTIDGDCEVENFKGEGGFTIGGLLNAETVKIKLSGESKAKEIGCQQIIAKQEKQALLKLIKSFFPNRLEAEVIEGDEIELEGTTAQVVRGNQVVIGPNCEIGLVEYSGTFFQDKNAVVKESRKI
ncbi:polymer-forming cytoskeletal protein [Falsibacillus pallidus]|uniref:polymer-forming cytoskeletal protein n=1 Tax=Falsibacillus pallidus TaxID=493781 RepID=UPI003D992D8B